MKVLAAALCALMLMAAPADAGPVGAAIAAVGSWFAGLGVIGQALVRIGVGLLLNALAKAQMAEETAPSGIKTEATLTGGDNSEGFVLGRYATGGVFVAPPLTYGSTNRRLVYVVDLGGLPGQTLERVFVNGEPVEFGAVDVEGRGVRSEGGTYHKKINLIYHDGTQTAADPYLLDKFGSHPDFPWSADMIGRGRCYAILTFYMDKEKARFNGLPTVRFEVQGVPLYDPRKDGSAGGTGAHRWDDPATWEQTDNPAVMVYNIKRGIALPDGSVWGGRATAVDLPLSVWAAAMNECEVQIARAGGGSEPQFRAGVEVSTAVDEPAEVIERLLAACSGDVAEEGGAWYIHIGAPALPTYFFSDDDVIVSEVQQLDPFPGLSDTVNALTITYPDPATGWESKDAPQVLRSDLEASDDGQRLFDSLALSACPYPSQVQRLGKAYIEDARRFRTHRLTLPPDAARVPPLATVSWTSARNGYAGKLFEVARKQVQLRSLLTHFAVRERDPADYAWSVADEVTVEIPTVQITVPEDFVLQDMSVTGVTLSDAMSEARRPAILVQGIDPEIEGVDWQVRLAGGDLAAQGTAREIGPTLILSQGLLPDTDYEVSLRPTGDGLLGWSAWLPVTTPDVRIAAVDLEPALSQQISDAYARHDLALKDATGVVAEFRDLAELAFGPLDRPTALADEIPRLESGLEEAYQRLIGLEWAQFTTGQTLAGAGVIVDPDTGQVRVLAFERAEQRISEVQIGLDAATASLNLKASVAYVDQAISSAVLDPSQIPVIAGITAQLTTVETTLDAETGRIDALADTLTVNGGLVTMTTVTQTLNSLQGQIDQRVTQADFDDAKHRLSTAEQSLAVMGDAARISQAVEATYRQVLESEEAGQRAIADLWDSWQSDRDVLEATAQARRDLGAQVAEGLEAQATERAALAAEVDGNAASLVEEARARAEQGQALSQRIDQVTTEVGENAALIASESQARADANSALAGRADAIEAALADPVTGLPAAHGRITAEEQARADANSALAGRADAIEAALADPETGLPAAHAGISELAASKVDGAGAVAAVEQEIVADFGSLAALAQEVTTVKATSDGLSAAYVLRLNAGGASAGLELVAADNVDGPVSSFRISADQILLDGSVTAAKMSVTELSAITGTIGTFRTSPSGERTEISDEGVRVYDASGLLVVELGELP
ncbi:hypothetical protein KUV98_24010 [Mameliella alba]|nr:hypothetical protein [Mameliella alba]